MGGQTPCYNSRKELRIEPYILRPPLRELERLLYEMVSETGRKTRLNKANQAFINMDMVYLRGINITRGEISYRDRNKPIGRAIGSCIIMGNQVSPNKIICYNENMEYEILSPHLENIRETVKDVLSTLYWKINRNLRKEMCKLGYTSSEIESMESSKFAKVYAEIPLDQQLGNPQINIIVNNKSRGIIIYRNGKSELTLYYLFYELL